jgi:hypothetical protein
MATLNDFILLTATCISTTVRRQSFVVFALQLWLGKRPTVLRYTYVTYLENFTLVGYYAASNGDHLPTFRENVSVTSSRVYKFKKLFFLDFLTFEDGTDTLSRNVGKGSPFDAA